MTRLVHVIRHAEADGPGADPGLSPRGRLQARALGERLAQLPVVGIHHGPRRRAAETAAILGRALPHADVHESDHLADRTPVPSEGPLAGVPARYRDWLAAVPAVERDPGAAAISAGIGAFTRDDGAGDLVLVTHAFVVASFVTRALDAPPWRWMGLNPANASLTTLAVTDDRPVLVSFNDTGHLVGLR